MMLRYSFDLAGEAGCIERAVDSALADGLRTADIAAPGAESLGCRAMTDAILARI